MWRFLVESELFPSSPSHLAIAALLSSGQSQYFTWFPISSFSFRWAWKLFWLFWLWLIWLPPSYPKAFFFLTVQQGSDISRVFHFLCDIQERWSPLIDKLVSCLLQQGHIFRRRLNDPFLSQNLRGFCGSSFQEQSLFCVCTICLHGQILVACRIPTKSPSPPTHTCSCTLIWTSLRHSLIIWFTISFHSFHSLHILLGLFY